MAVFNPAAVPVIKESLLLQNLDKRIGELATIFPLTYYFGTSFNLIGVLLENEVSGMNEPGDLLIVQKGAASIDKEKLVYDKVSKRLFITTEVDLALESVCVVGDIIEERFNGLQR